MYPHPAPSRPRPSQSHPSFPLLNHLMGFPMICYLVPIPEPIILLLEFLGLIRFAISLVLFFLGLYPSSRRPTPYEDLQFRPSRASDVLSPNTIKDQLPAVEFASLVEGPARRRHGRESTCVVCLENLEARDVVRELGNCRHAFHRGCIDRWVDMGQVTCPLCRAQLLPSNGRGVNFLARIW